MLINDLTFEFKDLVRENHTTQQALADKLGIKLPNIARFTKNPINKGYLKLMETLGYDIKITYVPRKKSLDEVL